MINTIKVLAIILSISAVSTYCYHINVEQKNITQRRLLQSRILLKEAPSPYRYRVLAPYIGELFSRLINPQKGSEDRNAFLRAFLVYDFSCMVFSFFMLYLYLTRFFSDEQSLIGVLFSAATAFIAYKDHYYQPWSLLEPGLFALALICFHAKRYWAGALVIIVSSLNKETAIFLPLIYFFAQFDFSRLFEKEISITRNALLVSILYGAISLTIFFGLRFILGDSAHIHTVKEFFTLNTKLHALKKTFVNVSLLLGFFWIFAVMGYMKSTEFIKRTAHVIPLYLVAVLVYGMWYEVRLLTTLYPILVPLALSFLFPPREEERESLEPLQEA